MEITEVAYTAPLIGAMMRIISIFFFAACSLMMSACSTLTRMQYYAPLHQNAIPEDRLYLDSLRLTGPPITQRINIGSADLVTGVSSDVLIDGEKTYSFGPAWVPVIPTLFNWFIPYKKIGDDVGIMVIFKNIKNDIEWEPNKSIVVVSEGSPIFPSKIEGQNRKVINQGEILKIRKSWTSWEVDLQFPLPKNTNEFTLIIRGLSSDEKETPEIPIRFKYSKGWMMGFIP